MTTSYYPLQKTLHAPDAPFVVAQDCDEATLLRTLATTHWYAHVPLDPVTAKRARTVQNAASLMPDSLSDIAMNNVSNLACRSASLLSDIARTRLNVERPEDAAKRLGPVLNAMGLELASIPDANCVWLAGDEVLFHVDECVAENRAFLLWMVAGPDKVLEFPGLGAGVPMRIGSAVLFDGMQTHGLRRPQNAGQAFHPDCKHNRTTEDVLEEDIAVFLSLEFDLTPQLCDRMGIEVTKATQDVSDPRFAINEFTGRTVVTWPET